MTRPLRVAFVVTGGLDRSGREHVIPSLLWLLERQARRHAVTAFVLCYHDHPVTYRLRGATIRDLGQPSGLLRQYSALLRGLRDDGPFDVIHAYWALPAGLVATMAGRRLGIPTLLTLDSGELVALPDIEYGLQRLRRQRLAVKAALRLATRITVCTDYMKRLAAAHHIEPMLLPIGVDADLFLPHAPPSPPPWRLLHVASLNAVKDQPTLLEAFRLVRRHVPEVTLDIVGEDTRGGDVQRLAKQMDLGAHVTFHGFVPTEHLPTFYQRAHLLVHSSRHEAAGVVFLEAACCGVPIVGTAVGYLADWGANRAVAVPPGDSHSLAGAIVRLLPDAARRARLAEAAQQWARAHDANWTAEQLDSTYRQLSRRH